MAIDVERRRPVLGSGAAVVGCPGPAVHAVAVRAAVFDVHAAYPEAAIIGVGGVMCGEDAVELIMAGAEPSRWLGDVPRPPGPTPDPAGDRRVVPEPWSPAAGRPERRAHG